jgi:nucleoid-associated protein YgaU
MRDPTSRIFAVLGLMIAVWVVVYWLYEPGSRSVVLDDRPPVEAPAPAAPDLPQPDSLPPAPPRDDRPVDPPQPAPTEPPILEPAFNAAPETLVPKSGEVLIPPEFEEYTVQPNETLQDIARRRYGDAARWKAISRANPLVPTDRLKPGRTVLRLPKDPDNIQGRIVKIETPVPPPTPSPAPASTPAAGWRTYTVQESDTLWGIARKMYGRPLTELIAEANTDVLPDPDRIKAGIVLKIPPAPPAD